MTVPSLAMARVQTGFPPHHIDQVESRITGGEPAQSVALLFCSLVCLPLNLLALFFLHNLGPLLASLSGHAVDEAPGGGRGTARDPVGQPKIIRAWRGVVPGERSVYGPCFSRGSLPPCTN